MALAIKALEKAAQQDYAPAIKKLAALYMGNNCSKQDMKKAVEYNTKLAENGDADAMQMLGNFLCSQNQFDDCFKWARKAVENGKTGTFFTLGAMYADGDGTTADKTKAYACYLIAIDTTDKASAGFYKQFADELKAKLSPAEVKAAENLFKTWKKTKKFD